MRRNKFRIIKFCLAAPCFTTAAAAAGAANSIEAQVFKVSDIRGRIAQRPAAAAYLDLVKTVFPDAKLYKTTPHNVTMKNFSIHAMNKNKNHAMAVNFPASRNCFFTIIFLLLCVSAFVCPAQEKKQIRISAIQAKLFYNNTGTLSENVLTEKGADLWNSPFDATYSTLVLVELDGLPEYLESNIRIELTARYIPFEREKGSIIVRQFETIRNGSETGRAYAGFWLKRTGCNPVYLTARIVGRRQQQRRVKEKINFGCGE